MKTGRWGCLSCICFTSYFEKESVNRARAGLGPVRFQGLSRGGPLCSPAWLNAFDGFSLCFSSPPRMNIHFKCMRMKLSTLFFSLKSLPTRDNVENAIPP